MDGIKQYQEKKRGYVSGFTNREVLVESTACLCVLSPVPGAETELTTHYVFSL